MKIFLKRLGFLLLAIALLSSSAFMAVSCEEENTDDEELEDTLPEEEEEETVEAVENRILEIVGYRNSTDYNDRPTIIIKFRFTNNSSDAVTLESAFDYTPFQDGIEMERAFILKEERFNVDNEYIKIKDGASIELEMAYVYNNLESDVKIEVEKFADEVNKKFDLIIELD